MNKIILLFALFLSFSADAQNLRYLNRVFAQSSKTPDVTYGNAPAITSFYISEATTTPTDLKMDIFQPVGDAETQRPVIIFMHSGGFINGSKANQDMQYLCDSFARRGYVTCSVGYRLNFNLLSGASSERAVYRGLQDAAAAIRYLKAFRNTYKIDTSRVFACGSSAGGFSALNLAYFDDSERPASTFAATGRPDLGCVNCSGNTYPHNSKVKAIANYWGAIGNLSWINNDVPAILFHGSTDPTVPYNQGSPFGLGTLPTVYGSLPINTQLNNQGITHEFYTGLNKGHEYWGTTNGTFVGAPTADYLDIIQKTAAFFYNYVPVQIPAVSFSNSTVTPPTCNGGNNGSISVAITGGGACTPTYYWTNGQTGATATNLSAGNYTCVASCGNQSVSKQFIVYEPDPINISTSNIREVTCLTNGAATVLANGGSGGFSYIWSNGNSEQTINTSLPNTYSVTATDINACKKVINVTIPANNVPPVINTIPTVTVTCAKASEVLSASTIPANLNYLWSNNATTSSVNVSQAGTYSLTVTNPNNGCKASATATVIEDKTLPVIQIQGNTGFCKGKNVTLTALSTAALYQWSNGATTKEITINTPGNYIVTITGSNACKNSASKTLIQFPEINFQILGDTSFCEGASTTLSTTGSFASYVWNNLSNTAINTVNKEDNVSVTVTDSNGCTASQAVKVNIILLPDVTISGKTVFCENSTTTLTATPNVGTYFWSNGDVKNEITVRDKGPFVLTVTNAQGCSSSARVTVTESKNPSIKINDIEACEGQNVTLQSNTSTSNSDTYEWTNENSFKADSANIVFKNLKFAQAGRYFITVKNSDGCAGKDTMELKVSPKMSIKWNATVACNDLATVSAEVTGGVPNLQYVWNQANLKGKEITIQAPATVQVSVTDAYGCEASSQKLDLKAKQKIQFVATIVGTSSNTGSIRLSFPDTTTNYTYVWSNGATTQNIKNLPFGKYCVTLTDADTCTKSECFEVEKIISTKEENDGLGIEIYPNPSKDFFQVIFTKNNNEAVDLTLVNLQGQILAKQHIENPSANTQFDTSNLPKGIYFLWIKSKNYYQTEKVEVE